MKLPARVGLITLACRDVERMAQLDVAWAKGTSFDDRGGVSFP